MSMGLGLKDTRSMGSLPEKEVLWDRHLWSQGWKPRSEWDCCLQEQGWKTCCL